MWTVARPEFDVEETYRLCISNVASDELRRRLESVANDVVVAAEEYAASAEQQELHLFPRQNNIAGVVTRDEMVAVYDGRMVG